MTIANLLINWYENHKRDLPWRNIKDPYKIWLSEIILQQTRVQQGLPYYHNFISKYPTVKHLAKASEEDILKTWQGLGYYSRARNLHATAKIITNDYNGVFPVDYKQIIALKGIGHYTAAAICSFAYQQVIPVIDGNVYRVLSRVFWIDSPINGSQALKHFEPIAQECISKTQPDIYNQAIMELGALVCTPKSPNCTECPINSKCIAFEKNDVESLPIKIKSKKSKNRFFNYLVFNFNNSTLLEKRTKTDIWKGLFQFPLLESDKESDSDKIELYVHEDYKEFEIKKIDLIKQPKHILSHQNIFSYYWIIELKGTQASNKHEWKGFLEVKRLPVSKNIERFLNTNSIFL
jgi:A/G-specific adenine glycosylase